MTSQELVNKAASDVRNSPELMALYITIFTETFGRAPDCAGCTFKNDFSKLKNAVLTGTKKQETMLDTSITFKLKKGLRDKILSYKKGQQTFRTYAKKATDDFMLLFLTEGTEEQLAKRLEIFEVLPEALRNDETAVENMDRTQLVAFAKANFEVDLKGNKAQVLKAVQELLAKEEAATKEAGAGDTGAGDAGAGDTGAGDAGAGDTGAGDAGAGDAGAGAEDELL